MTSTGIVNYDPHNPADQRIVLLCFRVNCLYQRKLVKGILLHHQEIAGDDSSAVFEPAVLLGGRVVGENKR